MKLKPKTFKLEVYKSWSGYVAISYGPIGYGRSAIGDTRTEAVKKLTAKLKIK